MSLNDKLFGNLFEPSKKICRLDIWLLIQNDMVSKRHLNLNLSYHMNSVQMYELDLSTYK